MRLSEQGVAHLKAFEGYCAAPYRCPAGKTTVGYGHVLQPGEELRSLSMAEAEGLLRRDVEAIEKALSPLVDVPATQGQWDALVCLAFNIGIQAFKKSTLRRKYNDGDIAGAAAEFSRWVFAAGKPLPGLVRRREAEKDLFLSKIKGGNATP